MLMTLDTPHGPNTCMIPNSKTLLHCYTFWSNVEMEKYTMQEEKKICLNMEYLTFDNGF